MSVERLEYLRSQIRAESISYGEIVELQSLADCIEPGDVELLQWAGVDEAPSTPRHRAASAIAYVTDDRDPTTRDLLALMAIQHGADEGFIEDEERNDIVDEIVRETVQRLPLSRWGAPWNG